MTSRLVSLSTRPDVRQFSQRDIERAVRGALKGGLIIGRIEIRPDGTLVLFVHGSEPYPDNTLDAELHEWRRGHGEH